MNAMSLPRRRIGPFSVSAIGLGCMSLSENYGAPPPPDVAESVLQRALDLGIDFFDTAALYGFGDNETLLGQVLKPHRSRLVLASKCGLTGVDGKRVVNNRPETLRRTCEEALRRLQTDVIDLYYLHRLDRQVPIEDSVGALADLVRTGKIRSIGLSEMSAATLRRAHAVHPIAAVQSEYSLWTREPEIAVFDALCAEHSVEFILPAHGHVLGGPINGARSAIAKLKAHRLAREAKVLAAMQALPDGSMEDWVQHAYDDVPPRMWPVAQRSLLAHVERIRSQQPGNN